MPASAHSTCMRCQFFTVLIVFAVALPGCRRPTPPLSTAELTPTPTETPLQAARTRAVENANDIEAIFRAPTPLPRPAPTPTPYQIIFIPAPRH